MCILQTRTFNNQVGYVCCSRCHSVIPIQTCEVTNCTNILKNKTQKDVQLQKTRSSSLNHYTYRNGNLGSTSGSAEYKAMASQWPKASFTILNACPRSIPCSKGWEASTYMWRELQEAEIQVERNSY